jgi:hypothetical protein
LVLTNLVPVVGIRIEMNSAKGIGLLLQGMLLSLMSFFKLLAVLFS